MLGLHPAGLRLVGPVVDEVAALSAACEGTDAPADPRLRRLPSDDIEGGRRLGIGFMRYGAFGQHLLRKLARRHDVRCVDRLDKVRGQFGERISGFSSTRVGFRVGGFVPLSREGYSC